MLVFILLVLAATSVSCETIDQIHETEHGKHNLATTSSPKHVEAVTKATVTESAVNVNMKKVEIVTAVTTVVRTAETTEPKLNGPTTPEVGTVSEVKYEERSNIPPDDRMSETTSKRMKLTTALATTRLTDPEKTPTEVFSVETSTTSDLQLHRSDSNESSDYIAIFLSYILVSPLHH